jgi:hypothetical protein
VNASAITAETCFVLPDHVMQRAAGGETVILNLDNEQYYGLDEVGARAFALAQGGTSFGGIVRALLEEYEVDEATLHADLEALFADLLSEGLLSPA